MAAPKGERPDESPAKSTRAKPRRGRKLLIGCGLIAVVVGVLIAVLHIPDLQLAVFEHWIRPALERSTGLELEVASVRIQFLRLGAELGGIKARASGGGSEVLTIQRAELGLPLTSLLSTPILDIRLDQPEVWLELDEAGRWNVPILNGAPAKQSQPRPLPELTIRELAVKGFRFHFRRPGLNVGTDPFDINANLELASLRGGADVSFGGVLVEVGNSRIPIEALTLDADSKDDKLTLSIAGKAPGLDLDAKLGLGSVRRFAELSGTVTAKLQGEKLPPGLLPMPISGSGDLTATLSGTPAEPRIEVTFNGQQLRGATQGWVVPIAEVQGDYDVGAHTGTARLSTRGATYSRDGKRYETDALSGNLVLSADGSARLTLNGVAPGAKLSGLALVSELSSTGALTGDIQLDATGSELPRDVLPSPIGGHGTAHVKLGGTLGHPTFRIEFEGQDLVWNGTTIPGLRASGELSFPDAGLTLSGGQIEFAEAKNAAETGRFAPQGKASLSIRDGTLHIEDLRLRDGPTSITANGNLGTGRAANLTFEIEAPDLSRYADLVKTDLAGSLSASGRLHGSLSAPSGNIRFSVRDGRLSGKPFGASGQLELADGKVSLRDVRARGLDAEAGVTGSADIGGLLAGGNKASGSFTISGLKARGADLGTVPATISMSGDRVELAARALADSLRLQATWNRKTGAMEVHADGKDLDLGRISPFLPADYSDLRGRADLTADVTVSPAAEPGGPTSIAGRIDLQSLRASLHGQVVALSKPTRIELGGDGRIKLTPTRLDFGDAGALDVAAETGPGGALDATARGKLSLTAIGAILGKPELRGQADLDLRISGKRSQVSASGSATVRDLAFGDTFHVAVAAIELETRAPGAGAPAIVATIHADGVSASGRSLGKVELTAEVSAPLGQSVDVHGVLMDGQVALAGKLDRGALKATLDLRDLDFTPIAAQFAPSRLPISGTLNGQLTLDAPELKAEAIRGQLKLDRLEGRAGETPFHLVDAPAIVRIEPQLRASTERFEIDLGAGDRLLVRGSANLLDRTGHGTAAVALDLRKISPLFPEPVAGRLEANAEISEKGAQGTAQVRDLNVAGNPLGVSDVRFVAAAGLDRATIDAQLLGGQVSVRTEIGANGLSATADLRGVDLAPWLAMATPNAAKTSGTASGRIEITTPKLGLKEARGTARLDALSGQVGGLTFALIEPPVIAVLEPGAQLHFDGKGLQLDLGGGDHLVAQGTFDLDSLRGQGDADLKLDLAKLSAIVGRELAGSIAANGQFEADLANAGSRPSSGGSFHSRSQLELTNVRLDAWLPPSFPGPDGQRELTASGVLDVSGVGFSRDALKAELDLTALSVRGAGLELRVTQPSKAFIDKGRFSLGPLELALGTDTVNLQATGTLAPFTASGAAKGAVDLATLGKLLGVEGATGRVEIDATADIAAPNTGASTGETIAVTGRGLNATVQLHDVILGPWIDAFGLAPGIRNPSGLVNAELRIHGTSFRPQDLQGELTVSRIELKLDRLQGSTTKPFSIRRDGDEIRLSGLEMALGGNDRLILSGTYSVAAQTIDLAGNIGLELQTLGPWLGPSAEGRIEGQIQARGPLRRPEVVGSLTGSRLKFGQYGATSLKADLRGGAPNALPLVESSSIPVLTGSVELTGVTADTFSASAIRADLHTEGTNAADTVLVGQANIDGFQYGDQQLGTVQANARLDRSSLTFQGHGFDSSLTVDGVWPFDSSKEGRITFDTRSFQLGAWLALAKIPVVTPPKGRLSAHADVQFPGRNLSRMSGTLDLSELGIELDALTVSLGAPSHMTIRDGKLTVQNLTLTSTSSEVGSTTEAPTPATSLVLNGSVARNAMDLRAEGSMPLSMIRPFFVQFESMEGVAELSMTITGSPDSPEIRGTATVAGATVVYARPRLTVEHIEAHAEAHGRRIDLTSVKGEVGGGLVSAQGTIDVGEGFKLAADLQIRALDTQLVLNEFDIDLHADATLTYRGPIASGLLQGEVQLAEVTYSPRLSPLDLLDKLTTRVRVVGGIEIDPSVLGEEKDELIRPEPQFNLSVTAPADAISVESGPVQAKARLELQVTGKPSLPGILGTITVSDGAVNLYATKFTELKGTIDFDRNPFDLNPALELTATTTKDQNEIVLSITGRARGPVIELRSSQNQAQLDIVQTLIGGSASTGDLGELAERQVATFASQQLSNATGLEIELVPPPLGDLQILFAVGMRISERLFFKFYKPDESDASDILELQFKASDTVELEGRRTEDQTGTFRLKFRRKFD